MAVRVQVVMDCADPARLAAFWAAALDYIQPAPPEGFATWEDLLKAHGVPEEEWNAASAVEDPAGVGPRIYFQRVPESKTVKNRLHLDVNAGGGRKVPYGERRRRIDEKAAQLTKNGATVLQVRDRSEREPDYYGIVMADPEGNEFCLH